MSGIASLKFRLLFLALSIVVASGCEQLAQADKKVTGGAIGGVIGAVFGKVLSEKANPNLKPLIIGGTTVVGVLVGSGIGSYLNAQDQQRMNQAAQKALASGKKQTWSNPETKASGTAEVVKVKPVGVSPPRSKTCRTIRQTVVLSDGTEEQEDITACQEADGSWQPEASI